MAVVKNLHLKNLNVNVNTDCPFAPAPVARKTRKVRNRVARKARVLELAQEMLFLFDPRVADVVTVSIFTGKKGKAPKLTLSRKLAMRLNLLGGSRLAVLNCSDQIVSFKH